ncbi:MAG: hypothetical protein V1660_04185 [archaeon]
MNQRRNARDKRGQFIRGMTPWNKGHEMALDSREKESETKKLFFELGITQSARKGVKLSKKTKKKVSVSQKLRNRKHPEIGREHSKYMKAYWEKHPQKVEEHRKFLIALWKSPQRREEASKIAKEVYKNHPQLKEKSRKRFIAWLIEHGDSLKYIEQGKGNKYKLGKVTKNGEKVRSLYEVMIANWLFKNDIRYFYEGKQLMFPAYKKLKITFAVPDFFLPDYNALIEIYGGYPGTRTKNERKSNAYNYYGIPFLSLTPSDMNNLDYEIPKFLRKIGRNPKLGKKARKIMWEMLD